MPDGLWMPVYEFEENRFIVIGNPCYDTKQEAINAVVRDGFEMMCAENISAVTSTAFCIPFREEDAVWLLNCQLLADFEVAVFSGPLYDEEVDLNEK